MNFLVEKYLGPYKLTDSARTLQLVLDFMAKLIYAPLPLLLLLSLAGVFATSQALLEMESELGMLSSSRKDKHKHSGFSQAECPGACTFRCSKTQYHKPCMFFCQKCCFKCKCVPPGTYARKEACPCYNNWKTKRGGPKCP